MPKNKVFLMSACAVLALSLSACVQSPAKPVAAKQSYTAAQKAEILQWLYGLDKNATLEQAAKSSGTALPANLTAEQRKMKVGDFLAKAAKQGDKTPGAAPAMMNLGAPVSLADVSRGKRGNDGFIYVRSAGKVNTITLKNAYQNGALIKPIVVHFEDSGRRVPFESLPLQS
jgi:hypothetical protein